MKRENEAVIVMHGPEWLLGDENQNWWLTMVKKSSKTTLVATKTSENHGLGAFRALELKMIV